MRQKPHQIYLLIDPTDTTVRYVGNSKNPKSRLKQHIKESMERQNTAKKKWIYTLVQRNYHPIIQVVAQIMDPAEARIKESEVCHQYRSTILNLHDPKKGARDFHIQDKQKKPPIISRKDAETQR
jgi:peptide methionine sulfoxide reductase MsrA